MNSEKRTINRRLRLLETILQNLYGNVTVTDKDGHILYVSDDVAVGFLHTKSELYQMTMYDILDKGILDVSIAVEVINQKKQIMKRNQTLKHAPKIGVGNPVFDENGEIELVVIFSQDEAMLHDFIREIETEKANFKHALQYADEILDRNMVMAAHDPVMKSILHSTKTISRSNSTIIIYGESGTGKEVLARFIHKNSNRNDKIFVPVNCAAIPAELMESEFFGYEKGAFTGANMVGKPGLFEICHNGTLFLDEIGELPLPMQSKLLRVLENGEIKRIGSSNVKQVDVRILAATNRNLQQLVREGLFREDLFYRISVIPITLPPLRERPLDLEYLIGSYLELFNQKYGRKHYYSSETVHMLKQYSWPGNIRELKNLIERMIVTSQHEMLTLEASILPSKLINHQASGAPPENEPDVLHYQGTLKEAMEQFEKAYIKAALNTNQGNISTIAKNLGIHPSGLYKKIEKYNLIKKYE